MVCGHCGEPLVPIPLIKLTQIFALIAATAFISPLLIMVLILLQDQKYPEPKRSFAPMATLANFLEDENT